MRAFLTAALAAFICISSAQAASLRVLLIGDTNDRSIGKSVVVDLANMETFVRQVSEKTGLKLDLKVLKGAQVKTKLVNDAINKLKIENDDTVIFYYSGHGFRTQQVKTKWPLLNIPDAGIKGVDFQWVTESLHAKKPRMVLAITDSCNSFIDTPENRGINSRAMQQDQDALWKKLFVEFSGRIYASGSIVGQYSFGQDQTGGAFTTQFLATIRSEVRKSDTNWDAVMRLATKKIPINNPQQRSQDPQYELVKGAGQTPQAHIEQAPTQAHEETSDERNEQCQSIGEFKTALASMRGQMPDKLNFARQRDEVASYREMVKALREVGGDKQMIQLTRTMDLGLKTRNWPKFRSAVWAYDDYIGDLKKATCGN